MIRKRAKSQRLPPLLVVAYILEILVRYGARSRTGVEFTLCGHRRRDFLATQGKCFAKNSHQEILLDLAIALVTIETILGAVSHDIKKIRNFHGIKEATFTILKDDKDTCFSDELGDIKANTQSAWNPVLVVDFDFNDCSHWENRRSDCRRQFVVHMPKNLPE